jgi:hypothetical protein
MKLKGNEIKVGDELVGVGFNGGSAQVKSLAAYIGTLLPVIGEGSQIAAFVGCNIEMTLCAKSYFDVRRAATGAAA